MSQKRKSGRFGYLSEGSQNPPEELPTEKEHPDASDYGDEVGSPVRYPSSGDLASVPKGEGRMRQQRTQLNVRIPTALKRQATAKAVLEGRDIGEIVEELLREYLED